MRAPLPETLERVDIEHELAESERTCPHHGVELERFAEVVSEQLDIVPAKVRVLRHIRGKYRCPSCEGHLRTAALPAQPLPKSFASPGLLAFIVTAKYVDGLPLYRQQQQFGRIGVELSRTTLARWVVVSRREEDRYRALERFAHHARRAPTPLGDLDPWHENRRDIRAGFPSPRGNGVPCPWLRRFWPYSVS